MKQRTHLQAEEKKVKTENHGAAKMVTVAGAL